MERIISLFTESVPHIQEKKHSNTLQHIFSIKM